MVWDQIGLRVPRFESRMHSQHQRLVINQESRGGKSLEKEYGGKGGGEREGGDTEFKSISENDHHNDVVAAVDDDNDFTY